MSQNRRLKKGEGKIQQEEMEREGERERKGRMNASGKTSMNMESDEKTMITQLTSNF